ncbi:MAG: hypothetical protein H6Q74_3 [Firmicutes bacterium]|nr:hypothetical protein [Bacillota bacterium]
MNSYRERYIDELNRHFGVDQRRINHALKVLANVELIMEQEKLSEETYKIIIVTALLHDVGIKPAEEKYQSSAGVYQEIEGPPIVRAIMNRLGEPEAIIERVAYIVGGHHTVMKNNGLDFQIIWEADLLVNIEEEGLMNSPGISDIIAKNFRTATGKRIAREMFL